MFPYWYPYCPHVQLTNCAYAPPMVYAWVTPSVIRAKTRLATILSTDLDTRFPSWDEFVNHNDPFLPYASSCHFAMLRLKEVRPKSKIVAFLRSFMTFSKPCAIVSWPQSRASHASVSSPNTEHSCLARMLTLQHPKEDATQRLRATFSTTQQRHYCRA